MTQETSTLQPIALELAGLAGEMRAAEKMLAPALEGLSPDQRESAANLAHYIAMRRRDLRGLQASLAALGLSSLGRSESHALDAVTRVLGILDRLLGREAPRLPSAPSPIGLTRGRELLERHAASLLGPPPPGRRVRVMVTMPGEAADDPVLMRDLLAGGMDCMRINTAHDDERRWSAMIGHLRAAERETGRDCRVLMDLSGPKSRTGAILPGPRVLKCRPRRDELGRVTRPARVWLTTPERAAPAPPGIDAVIPVGREWMLSLSPGERIEFRDARGADRSMDVLSAAPGGVIASCAATAYLTPGTRLSTTGAARRTTEVLDLPAVEQSIALRAGDALILTRDAAAGAPAEIGEAGEILRPARIPCTLAGAFDAARPADRVLLDDGKIGAVVDTVTPDEMRLRITATRPGGDRLRADKGINFPDTPLPMRGLSGDDAAALPFIAAHADLVGLSFVNTPADVDDLAGRLRDLDAAHLGVILKIETRRAFEHLPSLLLAAMRMRAAGVMIARGDLAVEMGFERLAEVQEEILWMCEAAHMPVIWATQVLESLAKQGQASRAEITDAAMGERAECVMLNKGPYIRAALRALVDIVGRMEAHQDKKRQLFRELKIAGDFAG